MVAKNEITRGRRHVDVVRIPRADPPEQVDVLVVGAGPSGLAAALDLDGHGVRVAAIDAAEAFPLVRAGAMGHSSRTVELFERWGVAERVRREWTVPPEWNRGTRLRTSLAGHDLAPSDAAAYRRGRGSVHSYREPIRRPQTALQKAFLDELAVRGVVVAPRWRFLGFEQDADGVRTEVEHVATGERRVIRSSYLIGADGSRSAVRTHAGVERRGEYATERHYRFVVRTRGEYAGRHPFPSATNVIVNAAHSGFLAALDEEHWRVYAGPYPLSVEPSRDELLDIARAAFGSSVDLELVDVAGYFQSTRIAADFRAGRVFFVGDAAHVRTPGGNLGEGFGDVANLGFKLAAVLRGVGGDTLLDSYDRERRPHNERVAAHAQSRAEESARNVEAARALGFPADDDTSDEATERRRIIGGILARDGRPSVGVYFDERYDDSPVIAYEPGQRESERAWDAHVYEPGGAPGHRAPDGLIDPFGGTLYGRLGSDVALLVWGDRLDGVDDLVHAAERRGIALEVIHADDPEGEALYGAPHVLVRPDHHVAWRGVATSIDPDALLGLVYGAAVTGDHVSARPLAAVAR